MLVSFSVANFRSFNAEQTFSLVASERLANSHLDHAIAIPSSKEKVLRTAVIYGANGSGKSNLFKALKFLKTLVVDPRTKNSGTKRERFRFDGSNSRVTSFDIQFVASEKLFRLAIELDDERIVSEWLGHVVGGKEKTIYVRTTSSEGQVSVTSGPGLTDGSEKLEALFTVGGPQNHSFLATILTTLDDADYGETIRSVLRWFGDELTLVDPGDLIEPVGYLLSDDKQFLEFAGEFLKSASTGIDHFLIDKREISEQELRALLPKRVVNEIMEDKDHRGAVAFTSNRDGNEILIERGGQDHYYKISVQAAHKLGAEKSVPLDLAQESDGTRRLLHLLPALHRLKERSAVYFIDEIDRSLHPILVIRFLEFFLKSCEGGHRQVIVTTHESNLLDQDLIRRDEIWFVEKNPEGATQLYSLVDFKPRNDLNIRKHYLQGRFGAVPYLGALDNLICDEEVVE